MKVKYGRVAQRNLAQIPPNQASSTLKRPKDTNGGAGVSPATVKARPPSKRPTVSHILFPQGTKYLKRVKNAFTCNTQK